MADESTNTARSKMLGVFISSHDENTKKFYMDLVEVSSTASDIVMEGVVNTLKARDIDIKKVRFSSLDGTNSMSGFHNGLQRRLRNHTPHAIYINCRCHRLALCFKHLFEEFRWLQSIDSLLLGLWKTHNYYSNNYETNLHPRFTAEFILESVEFIVKYQLPRQNTFKYPSKSSMYYFCSYISCSYYGLR